MYRCDVYLIFEFTGHIMHNIIAIVWMKRVRYRHSISLPTPFLRVITKQKKQNEIIILSSLYNIVATCYPDHGWNISVQQQKPYDIQDGLYIIGLDVLCTVHGILIILFLYSRCLLQYVHCIPIHICLCSMSKGDEPQLESWWTI